MRIALVFGLGDRRILAQGNRTDGIVTEVRTCWWLKVNTKPVRSSALDGALFPHIIHFSYSAGGREHTGKRFLNYAIAPPVPGERIEIYYDGNDPRRYALQPQYANRLR